jgi:hypothetical protein
MDRCQADISTTRTVASLVFKVIEEPAHEWGVNIVDPQIGWALPQIAMSEPNQNTKGVTIISDGVRARTALAHQALGKVGLK